MPLRYFSIVLVSLALLVWAASPASADPTIGGACPGGASAPLSADGNNVVCIGSVWQYPAYQFGSTAAACNSTNAGIVRWTGSALQFCNSTSWSTVGSAAAAGSTGYVQFNLGSGAFAGDTNLFWDNTNKKLGIGTTSPSGQLHVYAPSTAASGNAIGIEMTGEQSVADTGTYFGANIVPTNTATSGTLAGLQGIRAWPQNTDLGTVTNMYGVVAQPQNTASGTVGTMYGAYANPSNTSNGTVTTMVGVNSIPQNTTNGTVTTMWGVNSTPQNISNGTVTTMMGVRSVPSINPGASGGITSNMYGVYSNPSLNGVTTVSTMYGYYGTCTNGQVSATIGTCYELYLDATTTSGPIGTLYGIYQKDAAANNYFNGDIGIGVTSPLEALDINGNIRLARGTSNVIYYGTVGSAVPGAGSVGEKIQLFGTADTVSATDYALGIESSNMWFNTGGGFKWYKAGAIEMVLDTNGNVGIGTTSPATNLDIQAARTGTDTLLNLGVIGTGVVGDSVGLTFSSPGTGGAVHVDAGINGIMGQTNGLGSLAFSTARSAGVLTEAMRIDDLGNVGIGTTSPSYLLDVKGTIRTTQAVLNSSAVPTISTCGTSPPAATAGSNNNSGQFTLGTGATAACTVTFANAFPTAAYCTVTPASSYAGTYYISAQSKSAFTVTLGTGTASVKFNYTCGGN